jgi:hypothetical protein
MINMLALTLAFYHRKFVFKCIGGTSYVATALPLSGHKPPAQNIYVLLLKEKRNK